jgi:hypothetical protein
MFVANETNKIFNRIIVGYIKHIVSVVDLRAEVSGFVFDI